MKPVVHSTRCDVIRPCGEHHVHVCDCGAVLAEIAASVAEGAWICVACRMSGARSFVMITNQITRGALPSGYGINGYADEEGRVHQHRAYGTLTNYGCSGGHRWQVATWPACPTCGWQAEADKRESMDDAGERERNHLARAIEMLTPAGMGGLGR